jgi:hypothetical protein
MMPKITYKGESDTVRIGRQSFKKGEAVEVTDENVLRKAVNNPFLEVSGYDPKPVTTTTVTVDNPNVDPKKQAKLEDGNPNARSGGIGTEEPLRVEQPAKLEGVYPDSRNKAGTGGSGVATTIEVDPDEFNDEPSVATPEPRLGSGSRATSEARVETETENASTTVRTSDGPHRGRPRTK